jgi:hypothetical protein
MSDQNNTPPPPDVELKFQMQDMTKMMERMNFVMGNVCDRLKKVGKQGNVARTCSQDMRKVGAEPKSNSDSGAERPRWADYEVDVDDIVDGGFNEYLQEFHDSLKEHKKRAISLPSIHGV